MRPLRMPFYVTTFVLVILGLSSCTTYQYAFIKTNNPDVLISEENDFVKEDDRVRVSYCFFGQHLPVQITVENKMNQPIYINWRESALIVENMANSYMSRRVPIVGSVSTTTYSYHDHFHNREVISESISGFAGEAYLPEEMSFIPPRSHITNTPVTLDVFELEKMPKELFRQQLYPGLNGKEISVKAVEFTERNSPLRFKSYLTFFTTNAAGRRNNTWSMEQSFYVSDVIKGGTMDPKNFEAFVYQHGNFLYIPNYVNNKYLIYGFGIGLVVVSAAIMVANQPDMDMDMPSW